MPVSRPGVPQIDVTARVTVGVVACETDLGATWVVSEVETTAAATVRRAKPRSDIQAVI
jgi:hypothetical protein